MKEKLGEAVKEDGRPQHHAGWLLLLLLFLLLFLLLLLLLLLFAATGNVAVVVTPLPDCHDAPPAPNDLRF